jgi:hypothetical protein
MKGEASLRERSHFSRNIGIGHLVMTVKSVTGKFHDEEVAGLVSAVLNRPEYGALNHCQWRSEHAKDLATPVDDYFYKHLQPTSKSSGKSIGKGRQNIRRT